VNSALRHSSSARCVIAANDICRFLDIFWQKYCLIWGYLIDKRKCFDCLYVFCFVLFCLHYFYFFILCFIFLCWLCNWLLQLLRQHVKIKNSIEFNWIIIIIVVVIVIIITSNSIIKWNRIVLEELIVAQLIKTFPALTCGSRMFIIEFTRAHNWNMSWETLYSPNPHIYFFKICFNIIFHLRFDLPSDVFLDFITRIILSEEYKLWSSSRQHKHRLV
jgi:hypothetical protein